LNGVDGVCITKLDVLDGNARDPDLHRLHGAGEPVALLPIGADAVAECIPRYETLPGWSESTVGARSIDALPRNARAYLERIETLTSVPIAMVSTGADRAETILLHHPFN
jgi:adenylosuccinate synthase